MTTDLHSQWHGKAVIVRTTGAGVHFGYVTGIDSKTVTLERSRRLWRWFAKENGSLSAVATHGIDVAKSNIGDPVTVTVVDPHEIIAVMPDAIKSIEAGKWHR